MKAAIMQPYFFPYIGYFQLMNAVDVFVVFDDVNYIKKGWVNRNQILVNGNANMFSIPLKEASQNKLINEIDINANDSWNSDLLKTIEFSYKKAPNFSVVFPLIQTIANNQETNLAKFITQSLKEICAYLEIDTKIMVSSDIEKDNSLKGQDKILDICKRSQATDYINAIGGMDLYDSEAFSQREIALHFIKSLPVHYPQFKNEFIPWLSVIDVMMFNTPGQIKSILNNYELV